MGVPLVLIHFTLGIFHETIELFQATALVEECADGSTKSYNQQDMLEETYWTALEENNCL